MGFGKYIPSVNFGNVRDYVTSKAFEKLGSALVIAGVGLTTIGLGRESFKKWNLESLSSSIQIEIDSAKRESRELRKEFEDYIREYQSLVSKRPNEEKIFKSVNTAGVGFSTVGGLLLLPYVFFGRKEED